MAARGLTRRALAPVALAWALGGCALREPPQPSFAVGVVEPTTHLDPAVGDEPGTALVAVAAFETLAQVATRASASAGDRRVWNVEIVSGHRFADGTSLDAFAIAQNFARWRAGPFGPRGFVAYARTWADPAHPQRAIVSVDALDARRLRIRTRGIINDLLQTLGDPHFAIASPSAFAKGAAEFDAAPVGSGPFRFATWRRGEEIVLVPAGTPAPWASEVIRDVPDPPTTILALAKDDLAAVYGLPVGVIDAARAHAIRVASDPRTFRLCGFAPDVALASVRCPP